MFTLGEIAQITKGKLAGNPDVICSGISTDSRSVLRGELFFALKGPNFDGHKFVNDAHAKQAAAAVIDHPIELQIPNIIVPDTLKAFQQLAAEYRKRFSIPVIGVTGSVGKTTTKECIAVALSEVFNVRVSFGNWNNHIGVPTNLFRLSSEDQCLVLELGANHKGEIKQLAEMSQPSVGVITSIQPVHLEGFGSLEGVYQAKLELADFLDLNFGTLIVNGDNPRLIRRIKNRKGVSLTFGTSKGCDYRMTDLYVTDGMIYFRVNDEYEFRFKGFGEFNAMNALAAIAVAGYFKLDLAALAEAWRVLPVIESRFQIERLEAQNIVIVDDAYNANPASFKQAVQSFIKLAENRRKIVVMGDMLELGGHAVAYHEDLGRFFAESKIDLLIGVGPMSQLALREFGKTNPGARTFHFHNAAQAAQFLVSIIEEGDAVLIKGSHGIHLEQIRPVLIQAVEIATAI